MITLTASESQFVLYAKGHFGYNRPSQIDDMRILVANRAGMKPESISDRDIVAVMTVILDQLKIRIDYKFIHAIIFGEFWQKDKSNPVLNFVSAALAAMGGMPVNDNNGNSLVQVKPLDPNALTVAVPA